MLIIKKKKKKCQKFCRVKEEEEEDACQRHRLAFHFSLVSQTPLITVLA